MHKTQCGTEQELKSTPPTRAGTYCIRDALDAFELKSTPPTRAGTDDSPAGDRSSQRLNPPRPHGRGHKERNEIVRSVVLKSTPPTRAGTGVQDQQSIVPKLKSTPPTRAGTAFFCLRESTSRLNPPRPHGRGQIQAEM